ncbi:MAG: protein kinase [Gemmatales bacterium]
MNEPHHPSPQQLLDFALGRLAEADSLAVESHLAQCPSCMKALEEIPDDAVIQLIHRNLQEKTRKTVVGDVGGPASFSISASNITGEYTPHPSPVKPLSREEFQAGQIISDRFTLIARVGEGGMGEVWEAQQTQPVQRKVAIKLIKSGVDTKSIVQRFEQERQALALMDHPHIARVYDAGVTSERQPYFVMELVNGSPLIKFCDENRLGIPERLELFIPICHAVQHAHQKGIVHRDLKPANILVSMIDGKPVPKVIDFGVAKALNTKLTEETLATNVGAVVGTLEYMAPEQAGGSSVDIDTRADVYSLGVILYELLTGLRPFDPRRLRQAMILEIIRIVQEEEPSKPSTRLSTDESLPSLAATRDIEPKKLAAILRGELDWIVMKCLEKQRDRRYDTPNSLARDVQRYLAHETVEARPQSVGYQVAKFVRRHRGAVWAAGLITLALCLAVIGTTWGMVRAEEKQQEAEKAWKAEAERASAEAAAKNLAQKRLTQVEKSNSILASVFKQLDPKEVVRAERPLQAILVEKIQQAVEECSRMRSAIRW